MQLYQFYSFIRQEKPSTKKKDLTVAFLKKCGNFKAY